MSESSIIQTPAAPVKAKPSAPHFLIVATSLNPNSKSLLMAQYARERLVAQGHSTSLVSLRDLPLPMCDGTQAISHEKNAWALREEVQKATHVVFALPIYNFSANAAAKNMIELLFNWGCWKEDEWDDFVMGKTAGFLCTGGAEHSRMAVMSFANSLMLECWWWIAPRFVFATEDKFKNGQLENVQTKERIERLLNDMLQGPRVFA